MTIKEFLTRNEIRQLEIAKNFNIEASKLNKFLNGWIDLSIENQRALADYLKVGLDEIENNWISTDCNTMNSEENKYGN